MEYNGNIVEVRETPEKYVGMCEEIMPSFLELLSNMAATEEQGHKEYESMEAEKPSLGLSRYEAHPRYLEFWSDYRTRVGELLKPYCTEKLLKRGYGGHCGSPSKFVYINGKCGISFTMQTAKKASFEISFVEGTLNMKHWFSLKLSAGGWQIDDMKYQIEGHGKWENDSI